jgi:tetratricopeptide (TPR) repeat protein
VTRDQSMTDTAENLSSRANALIEMGRPEEAIPLLVRAIALEPDDVHTRCRFVLALMRVGKQPEALEHAEAALAVDASREWPHRLRAILLGQQGSHKEALESALEAVRIEPELPSALYTLGSVYVNLKRYRDADEVGVQILEAAPDDSDSHELLSFIAVRQNKHRDTEKHARESLRLNPENMDAMRFLAIGLRGQGKNKEATEAWLEVVRRNPTNKSYRHELVETSSVPEKVRTVVFAVTIISGLLLLSSLNDHGKDDPGPLAKWFFGLVFIAVPLTYGIWQQRFVKSLPGVVQSQLKRRRDVGIKIAGWSLLEVVLIWSMVMFGFAALMGVILSIIAFVEDKTFSVLFFALSVVPAGVSYGLWRASTVLSKRKKALKSQLD